MLESWLPQRVKVPLKRRCPPVVGSHGYLSKLGQRLRKEEGVVDERTTDAPSLQYTQLTPDNSNPR